MGHPTIYPTGVTIFDPDRAYPGYTLFQAPQLSTSKVVESILD